MLSEYGITACNVGVYPQLCKSVIQYILLIQKNAAWFKNYKRILMLVEF